MVKKHSEKGEKYMGNSDATIKRDDENISLILHINKNELSIDLTEENPIKIKEVFNKLIVELKKGKFQFELHDEEEDLFTHISKEYIRQLNSEISNVYGQLKTYKLLEQEASV